MHYTKIMTKTIPTSIRLTEDEIIAAKEIAGKKKLPYQTWIKEIVRHAILAEMEPIIAKNSINIEVKRMTLRQAILKVAQAKQWNPYTKPFKPKDLGLDASQYGSFSDHCITGTTQSSQYSNDQCLKSVEFTQSGKPLRYLLVY